MSEPTAHPVAEGIFCIDFSLGERRNSVYVVVGDRATVLFDAGIDGSGAAIRNALIGAAVDPELLNRVVVSHCDVDHFGGLASVVESFPGIVVAAHSLDAPLIEDRNLFERQRARGFLRYGLDEDPETIRWTRKVARTAGVTQLLHGGERLDLGGRAVEARAVPGHSAGSIALWVPDAAVALVSDAVLGAAVPFADGTPAFPPTYRFMPAYANSIRSIASWNPAVLATAHYGSFGGSDVGRFLEASAGFVGSVQHELESALAAGPATLAELATTLSPRLGQWPTAGSTVAMAYPLAGHLEAMQDAGGAAIDGLLRWRLT